jgi:hypothetical protein
MYQTFAKVPSNLLIPPEQGLYNVLNQYFGGTAAASTFGGTLGSAPLNYLQIYSEDIQYAEMNVDAPALIVQTNGSSVSMSAQELLNLASPKLLSIGEPAEILPPAPAITPGSIGPTLSTTGAIEPGEWISIYGTNIATAATAWTGNFPTSLAGVSMAIDGNAAYLSYVSQTQIDLQVPNDANTGTVPVVVTTPERNRDFHCNAIAVRPVVLSARQQARRRNYFENQRIGSLRRRNLRHRRPHGNFAWI